MDMKEVPESSNIKAYGYDPTTGRMTVRFNNGREYEGAVDPKIYEQFELAPSKGTYYAVAIRPVAKMEFVRESIPKPPEDGA